MAFPFQLVVVVDVVHSVVVAFEVVAVVDGDIVPTQDSRLLCCELGSP